MNSFTLFKNWDFLGSKTGLFAGFFLFFTRCGSPKKVIAGKTWCLYGSFMAFSLAVMEVFIILAGR